MRIKKYLYDVNHTRFQLVKSVKGNTIFNWFFLPGGPGVDSSNLFELINDMNFPGNYWLIDLPGNGTNTEFSTISSETFEQWKNFLVDAISTFDNPILVGHSFGGYLPLFCPELENVLKGLVLIGSTPTLDSEIFAKTAQEHRLPSLTDARKLFIKEKSLESLKALYMLETNYFFSPEYRELGINKIIKKMKFSIPAEYWWYTEGAVFFQKKSIWIPQKIPILIINGSKDYITPPTLFETDARFKRKNIKIFSIKDAGHFPWLEQSSILNDALSQFIKTSSYDNSTQAIRIR